MDKACKHCGKSFTPKKPWQKFCSPRCRFLDFDGRHPRLWRPLDTAVSASTDPSPDSSETRAPEVAQ